MGYPGFSLALDACMPIMRPDSNARLGTEARINVAMPIMAWHAHGYVQKEGREAMRRAGGLAVLIKLLQRVQLDAKTRQRAVGAIHNLSSEAEAVKLVSPP